MGPILTQMRAPPDENPKLSKSDDPEESANLLNSHQQAQTVPKNESDQDEGTNYSRFVQD